MKITMNRRQFPLRICIRLPGHSPAFETCPPRTYDLVIKGGAR